MFYMNCKCCGHELTIQRQLALMPGKRDMYQIECRRPSCKLYYATVFVYDLAEYAGHDFSDFGFVEAACHERK